MKRRNKWANHNGPGKPITQEQLAELWVSLGVKERFDENGKAPGYTLPFKVWGYFDLRGCELADGSGGHRP